MKKRNKLTLAALRSLLVAGCLIPVAASASDIQSHAPAWTPASLSRTLADMPYGNASRGEQLNRDLMCASCHGEKGIAPTPNWPGLAGQKADYTYKMLLDYKSGLRSEDDRSKLMQTLAELMSHQEMADVATYYATLQAPSNASQANDNPVGEGGLETAAKLVRKGDRSRLITPCASCHGLHAQGGKAAAPALTGLSRQSFIRTMQLYKNGKRHNDVNQSMSQFARKLSDQEIDLLADYYQTITR